MATETDSLKSEIKRIEFEIWAATDEVTRRKAALRKKKKELKNMKAKLKRDGE